MAKYTASLAPSDATTLVGDEVQRTSLTGKPIKYQHDHLSNMSLGDGGAGFTGGGIGVNTLPPGYTDDSRVRIPIKLSDVDGTQPEPVKKTSFFRKLSTSKKEEDFKMVSMSRGDYLKYWAKGDDGQFLPNVVEPEEGRQEWFRKQVELSDEMDRNDRIAGKAKHNPYKDRAIGLGFGAPGPGGGDA